MRISTALKKRLLAGFLTAGLGATFVPNSHADFSISYSTDEYRRHRPWWGHHHHRHYPHNFMRVYHGPSVYYYADGYYYQGDPDNYTIVTAPAGIVVRTLPVGYQRFVVRGQVYYRYNSVYYRRTSQGYQVVPAPVTEAPAQPMGTVEAPSAAPTEPADQNELTVNIPNNKGGYTAVTLKKSTSGFVGPQGEFYNEFPSIDHLKVIYGNT